jgi:large subunit ribosomal protein L9
MLTKDVKDVGRAGEVKEVADGYGRNFLIPRRMAVLAGKGVEAEAARLRTAASRRTARRPSRWPTRSATRRSSSA